MVLKVTLKVGLVLEATGGKALKRILDDARGGLVALKYLPRTAALAEALPYRRAKDPVAIHDPRAHAVLGLLGIVLTLILRDAGHHVLDQLR